MRARRTKRARESQSAPERARANQKEPDRELVRESQRESQGEYQSKPTTQKCRLRTDSQKMKILPRGKGLLLLNKAEPCIFIKPCMQEIVETTGCKKPCTYNEYKFTSQTPAEDTLTTTPENQIFIVFWAVSRTTQVEEEVLLYPLLSLVSDFGGTLGLFLGFSFLSLWQEIRDCFCNV